MHYQGKFCIPGLEVSYIEILIFPFDDSRMFIGKLAGFSNGNFVCRKVLCHHYHLVYALIVASVTLIESLNYIYSKIHIIGIHLILFFICCLNFPLYLLRS